jgi:phospholipase D1/2
MGDNDFRDVLMFDHTLRVRVGIHYTEEKFGIVLYTSSRRLKIKVNSSYELADWIEAIADSINKSPYCKQNRFSSFSPIRSKNWCKGYINAHEYYNDLAYDLEKAKNEIYITDWWLSPEVYLVRPIKKKMVTMADGTVEFELDTTWRLDEILKRRAQAGVKIFILLYREFE